MSRPPGAHDLLAMSARWALILVKSVLIVLMLHLLASHFHLRLFHEAGGAVRQTGRQAQSVRLTVRRA